MGETKKKDVNKTDPKKGKDIDFKDTEGVGEGLCSDQAMGNRKVIDKQEVAGKDKSKDMQKRKRETDSISDNKKQTTLAFRRAKTS